MNIGYLINNCSKLIKSKLGRELDAEGLTVAQFATIKDVQLNSFKEGREIGTTSVEIAERLDMDKPTVSGIVNRLIDNKYLDKSPNPNDRRSFILKLTNKSKLILPKLEVINEKVISESVDCLTKNEKVEFEKTLIKIIENMR